MGIKKFSYLDGGFACSKYPEMCKAPYSCGEFDIERVATKWYWTGQTGAGQDSLKAACAFPDHADYIVECLASPEHMKAAHVHVERMRRMKDREHALERDASVCFAEGLCL